MTGQTVTDLGGDDECVVQEKLSRHGPSGCQASDHSKDGNEEKKPYYDLRSSTFVDRRGGF